MLTIVSSANGAGKSLWGVHQVVRELCDGDRAIVTTLAIDKCALSAYLGEKVRGTVDERLVVIGEEDMSLFWRIRGYDRGFEFGLENEKPFYRRKLLRLGAFGDSSWTTGAEDWRGVLYVLDEAYRSFDARNWANSGQEFTAYQAQHRKCGDDVIAITPGFSLLEKRMRTLAKECVVLNNLYQVRIGWMTPPRFISYSVYPMCPPGPGDEPSHRGRMKIDPKGLAGCYNTAAGLGFVGSKADKGKVSRGVPWWACVAGCIFLALFAWKGTAAVMHIATGRAAKMVSVSDKRPAAAVRASVVRSNVVDVSAARVPALPFERYSGIARFGGSTWLTTTNGVLKVPGTLVGPPFIWEGRVLIPDKHL